MSEQQQFPPQRQGRQPGRETAMRPQPRDRMEGYRAAGRLEGRRAVVTGGDSGIGRAVAIGFAKEGADVVILYLDEHEDAAETKRQVEAAGRRCLAIPGDVGDFDHCRRAVQEAAGFLGGRIDILVNNAAEQHVEKEFEEIDPAQVERTFRTNIFAYFWMAKAVLPHMPEGGAIINTTSVTAYKGSPALTDYAATKGAIVAFTRSLSLALWERKRIRVNGVAPGPIRTPLIPASFDEKGTARHGSSAEMGHAGQPDEVAPCFVFLASDQDSGYMTGQGLRPNGGTVVNG
ncbi:SDR family oxidoreductase [Caldovatus aquaticus]|uniref:SDR family oxidoreductase n=1 Tax=Caldovatus aquaticus TaxID=2865671 RepID=A0ABS7F511_9PROT|nr:SDR family oxidoreductase [Caldovatus aquaticus]MBW8270717.1 SDR family oxidoreductase [Caldovatus aquaticus]